jgi:hypothetical protein
LIPSCRSALPAASGSCHLGVAPTLRHPSALPPRANEVSR